MITNKRLLEELERIRELLETEKPFAKISMQKLRNRTKPFCSITKHADSLRVIMSWRFLGEFEITGNKGYVQLILDDNRLVFRFKNFVKDNSAALIPVRNATSMDAHIPKSIASQIRIIPGYYNVEKDFEKFIVKTDERIDDECLT